MCQAYLFWEKQIFSDHGANRLGASALMQGLADGYFVLPYTICSYLNSITPGQENKTGQEAKDAIEQTAERIDKLFLIKGQTSPTTFHRRLGKIMWDYCGMARTQNGLKEALRLIPALREEFYEDLCLKGDRGYNQMLEKALRVADFLLFAELMCLDALERKESCGGHFREEYQTSDGEALRNDKDFCYVAAWQYQGHGNAPAQIKEALEFDEIELQQRSYK